MDNSGLSQSIDEIVLIPTMTMPRSHDLWLKGCEPGARMPEGLVSDGNGGGGGSGGGEAAVTAAAIAAAAVIVNGFGLNSLGPNEEQTKEKAEYAKGFR